MRLGNNKNLPNFIKWPIAVGSFALATFLLCACVSGTRPAPVTPASPTDLTTGTDVDTPVTPVQWTAPRDACAHTVEPERYASCDATCVADGYEMLRCPLCGQITITETPALGHVFAYSAPSVVMDATQTDSLFFCCTRENCGLAYVPTKAEISPLQRYVLPLDGTDAFTVAVDSVSDDSLLTENGILLPYGNSTWGCQNLSANARRFYAAAMQGLLDFAAQNGDLPAAGEAAVCLSVAYTAYDLTDAQARTALQYLMDDSPMLFWLDDTISVDADTGLVSLYVRDAYRDPAERIAAARQLETAIQTICGNKDVYRNRMEGAADFDVAIAAYRAVKNSLSLTTESADAADTAAGVLSGQCSARGYARLLTIVMNRISVPCITVRGENEKDTWNMLSLGGAWYLADAAADDEDDADWMRHFGMAETDDDVPDNTYSAAASSYPLPSLSAVAVGPVTLSNQSGVVGRFISLTAAFAAVTDPNSRYVITPDADLAVTDGSVSDPFAWSFTLPAGSWPKVGSLTFSGAVAPNDILGSVALPMQVSGNPVLSGPVTFKNVTPRSNGLLILLGAPLTFSGENTTLALSIGGDEKTSVTFDYSGLFTFTGHCQVGTVTFGGTNPVVEGIVSCHSLVLARRTILELRGDYVINVDTLTQGENSTMILTDRLSGKGTFTVGSVSQDTALLSVKLRILFADNYPTITFEHRVTVPTTVVAEQTASVPSAVAPATFDGVLYALPGGEPENWTLIVNGVDVTAQTVRDSAGQYRFSRD